MALEQAQADFLLLFFGGLLVVTIVLCTLSVVGILRAHANGDTGWLAAILVGWFFGLGWLVGLVYLLFVNKRSTARLRALVPSPPPAPSVSPGWYDDPTRRFEQRYWDGRRWTAHVATKGEQSTDEVRPGSSDLEPPDHDGMRWTESVTPRS